MKEMLLDPLQILGQQYHRNEYHSHKTLRKAKLFIERDSLCAREKAEKGANSPRTFRERVLKAGTREGTAGCLISLCSVLRLVGIKVKFQASSTFSFQPVWALYSCGQ